MKETVYIDKHSFWIQFLTFESHLAYSSDFAKFTWTLSTSREETRGISAISKIVTILKQLAITAVGVWVKREIVTFFKGFTFFQAIQRLGFGNNFE